MWDKETKERVRKLQAKRLEEKMKDMTEEQKKAFLRFWDRMWWDY